MPPPAAQPAAGLARLHSLYRAVLRAHREKLPPPLRALGDSYVQSELRRHIKGSTSERQWAEFGDQWSAYLSMLRGRADADEAQGSITALHEADERALNEEQRGQLARLKEAALQLGGTEEGRGDGEPDGAGGKRQ
jgi:hypothetical protein